jgi:hypothetical protein
MHSILELSCVLFYYSMLLLILKKWSFFKNSGIPFKTLGLLFTLKFIFGLSIYFVYTYYYTDRKTADIFKYFDDAKYLYENVYKISPIQFWKIIFGIQNQSTEIHNLLVKTNYWFKPFTSNVFNDNTTIIRFNAVIYLFFFFFYHVHTLVLSMLSFIGLTSIFRIYSEKFSTRKTELIIACFLIPSLLFWGSGVLKESILLFGIGVFLFAFTRLIYTKNKSLYIGIIVLTIGLLAITKTYVLILLIPSIFSWILSHYTKTKKVGLVFILFNIGLMIIAFNVGKIDARLDFLSDLKYKQKDFINVANYTKAGSTIHVKALTNSSWSFVKSMPEAFINGLLRPTIFEIKNVFFAFSAFENFSILVLIVLVVLFFKKPTHAQLPYLYFGIYFSVLLSILIGWTVPVLGAIVRYKIPCLPFAFSSLLLCIDFPKLKNYLKKKIQ